MAMIVVKLCVEDTCRLVEVAPTIEAIRSAVRAKFGAAFDDARLAYSLPGDEDLLLLVDDADLVLAGRFGTVPLKVAVLAPDRRAPPPMVWVAPALEEEASGDVYEAAAATLKSQDLEASPEQLRRLIAVLEFSPRRLVKFGLAPRSALKRTADACGGGEKEDDEDEAEADKPASADKPAEADKPVEAYEMIEKMGLDDNNATDQGTADQDKDDVLVLVAVPAADDDAEELPEATALVTESDNVVVAALRAKGVTLDAPVLWTLLLMLGVQPRRFKKLGLVVDLEAARAAYKAAAHKADKKVRKHGCAAGAGAGRWGHAADALEHHPHKKARHLADKWGWPHPSREAYGRGGKGKGGRGQGGKGKCGKGGKGGKGGGRGFGFGAQHGPDAHFFHAGPPPPHTFGSGPPPPHTFDRSWGSAWAWGGRDSA